jgi:hypothetical protein
MTALSKVIHVLALGLWFGSSVFFTFVATVLIFKTLREYGALSLNERPTWPLPNGFNEDSGTRLAGEIVAPMFPFYFLIQGICGFLAMITALGFTRIERLRRIHRLRFYVITLAVLTVIAGWPLNIKIHDLREQRYDRDPEIAKVAKAEFGRWHMISLFLNFGTVALVTVGMGMAAALPAKPTSEPKTV